MEDIYMNKTTMLHTLSLLYPDSYISIDEEVQTHIHINGNRIYRSNWYVYIANEKLKRFDTEQEVIEFIKTKVQEAVYAN